LGERDYRTKKEESEEKKRRKVGSGEDIFNLRVKTRDLIQK
jgi:hypothetical protein